MIRKISSGRSTNRKVLLVDREHELQNALIVKLKHAGFDTLTARRGCEALSIADREPLAMVIIDPLLQDMSGAKLGAMVKERNKVPFLFLTDRASTHYERAAIEAGAITILSKQSHPADLVTQIQLAIRQAVEIASTQQQNQRLARKINDTGEQEVLIGCLMEKWDMDKKSVKVTLNQFARARRLSIDDLAEMHANTSTELSRLRKEYVRRVAEVQPEVLIELTQFRDQRQATPSDRANEG